MRVEKAIRARIASLSAVAAEVGTRVHLLKLPQSPIYPAVRVQLIDRGDRPHLRGPDNAPSVRIQVDAFEIERSGQNPYNTVAIIIAAIEGDGLGRNASGIKGFKGTITSGSPPESVHIFGCFLRGERSPEYLPDEHRVVMMSQDYEVRYRMT